LGLAKVLVELMSVGFPASIKLSSIFGQLLRDAFGEIPYHVGSSIFQKDRRDVDVVVLLEDEDFEKMFGKREPEGPKWEAYCLAFSALGREVTGLNIDFKVQPREWANAKYPHTAEPRSAMTGFWRPT